MAAGRDYTDTIKTYQGLLRQMGYTVTYNGCDPKASDVFFVLYIPNPDNANEFSMAFLQVFTDAPLSLEGFITHVIERGEREKFIKDLSNRIKGCTVTKTDIVYCLLDTDMYTIDDVYGGGQLHLKPSMMKEVSAWVNFKGGRHALTPERVRAQMILPENVKR